MIYLTWVNKNMGTQNNYILPYTGLMNISPTTTPTDEPFIGTYERHSRFTTYTTKYEGVGIGYEFVLKGTEGTAGRPHWVELFIYINGKLANKHQQTVFDRSEVSISYATGKIICSARIEIGRGGVNVTSMQINISSETFFLADIDVPGLYRSETPTTSTVLGLKLPKCDDTCPNVNMFYRTDVLGSELGEMWAVIEDKTPKEYEGAYTDDLVGIFELNKTNNIPLVQTTFSYSPNLKKVLLLGGPTLMSQILDIYAKNTDKTLTKFEFFNLLMTYSTLRFMFSGFITGKFKKEWLYRKYTKSFLKKLASSDFACYVPFFTDPQYGLVGYDKYFEYGSCKC